MRMPRIVGILNVTPDSYVDGGKYADVEAAVLQAKRYAEEGADIIEVGGESTGPGSLDVAEAEELHRVIPVVSAIHAALPGMVIAVDTWKATVAQAALEAGASMINDITAGRGDTRMFGVVAQAKCPYIMMHAKDSSPRTTVHKREYEDIIRDVVVFLQQRVNLAVAAGIARDTIILDPGLGHFISADPSYSFEILDRLQELTRLGPVLVSPSRKSFLAGPDNLPPSQRLPATLRASVTAMKNGASYIRTHDVGATAQALTQALS